MSLPPWAWWLPRLFQGLIQVLDGREVALSVSPTGGGAQNSISGAATTFVLHRQCRESCCAPKSPTLQWYFPIKLTMAALLQLSEWAICKASLQQPRWKSFQGPFHPPTVLRAYQHPKPISSRWTRWPKPGAPETLFRAGLELNTCSLEPGHLLIDKLNKHSAAWLPDQDTCVQIWCWVYWEPYWILNWYSLDRWPPRHPPLPPEPLLHLCLCSFGP